MQKIKLKAVNYTSTAKPVAEYVVRLDKKDGALFARYFKVRSQAECENETIAETMGNFDPGTTPLLCQRVTERNFVKASAVTGDARVKDAVLSEIGRHIFRPTIGNASICGAGERNDFGVFVLPFGTDGAVAEPYNHFTEASSVKGLSSRVGRLRGAQAVFLLYADNTASEIDNWLLINIEAAPFVLEDATDGGWQELPSTFDIRSVLPTVTLMAPKQIEPNGSADVRVALSRNGEKVDYTGELVVEPVDGYVPKTRVKIVNGEGAFRIMAFGLEPGETMRVKVGTKTVSGIADTVIAVA